MMAFSFQLLKLSGNLFSRRQHRLTYSIFAKFNTSDHNGFALRRHSTDSTNSDSEKKPVSFGRRFLNALKLLASGSKLIVADARKMFVMRRAATKSGFHLLSGKAPPPEDVVLTRAELSFIIQVNI